MLCEDKIATATHKILNQFVVKCLFTARCLLAYCCAVERITNPAVMIVKLGG
jgi:hypothetical protein